VPPNLGLGTIRSGSESSPPHVGALPSSARRRAADDDPQLALSLSHRGAHMGGPAIASTTYHDFTRSERKPRVAKTQDTGVGFACAKREAQVVDMIAKPGHESYHAVSYRNSTSRKQVDGLRSHAKINRTVKRNMEYPTCVSGTVYMQELNAQGYINTFET